MNVLMRVGEILMEMEAKYYEMGPLKTSLSRRKVQSSEQIVLAHTTLDNMEASGPQTVATTLSYVVNHNIYFSSIRNMVKGLPTTVDSSEEGNSPTTAHSSIPVELSINPWQFPRITTILQIE